jgi:5-methylcytosine-specific restriction endonuclease McrA
MGSEYAKKKIAEYLALPGRIHISRIEIKKAETITHAKRREIHDKWAARWGKCPVGIKKRATPKAYRRRELLTHPPVAPPWASYPVAPYKYPVNTGTCTYCGYIATVQDHVIPYAYVGKSAKRRGSSDSGQKVPCCVECNTQLGNVMIVTVVDRAAYLFRRKKVHKRYSIKRLEWLAELASHS